MKKFGLLTTLLFGSFLFTGCTTTLEHPEIIDIDNDCSTDGNCLVKDEVNNPNVIYGGNGDHEVIGNEAFYINEKYGISFKLGEDSNGGTIREWDSNEYNEILDDNLNEHLIVFVKYQDSPSIKFTFTAYENDQFDKLLNNNSRREEWSKRVAWRNNKYTFGYAATDNQLLTDLKFIDIE